MRGPPKKCEITIFLFKCTPLLYFAYRKAYCGFVCGRRPKTYELLELLLLLFLDFSFQKLTQPLSLSFFVFLIFIHSFYYFLSPYLSIIRLYMSTYLGLPAYLHQHSYLGLPACLPTSTFLPRPTYLGPTYLGPTYLLLPIYVYLPTYIHLLIYVCLPTLTYLCMLTYLCLPIYIHKPSCLYQHPYLPLTTYQQIPTYINLPTPTNLCQPT